MKQQTEYTFTTIKGSDGQMDKVSASQPRDRGFEPQMGRQYWLVPGSGFNSD